NNQVQYRGGLYTKDGYYQANGAGYNYSSFIRISKDGKNAVILQTNVNQYQECNDNATAIYNMLFNEKKEN
ncbi:MAG: penicillin-binding protein, partial [Lactobacillus sp.]|nr:penicillin-binding protein [Lactobacillus sp.]